MSSARNVPGWASGAGSGRGRRPGLLWVPVWALVAAQLVFLPTPSDAQVAERRRVFEERRENVYLIIPAVASLPGVGLFVGVVSSFSNMGGTGIDAAVTVAESVEGSDISAKALAVREIPLFIPGLSLEYQVADIKLGNFTTFLPGRNSPNFTIPFTGEFDVQVLAPSLRLFERRLNLTYRLAFFEGFSVTDDGTEVQQASHGASGSLLLDFTDDVIDPRRGFRIGYTTSLTAPENSLLGRNSEPVELLGEDKDIKVENYTLTFYFPFSEQLTLAWHNFYSLASGNEGSDQVVSGAAIPLRGYPGNRWRDRFGVFTGLEARYTLPLNQEIDFLLMHGLLEGIQFALFYEVGQVNPDDGSALYDDLRNSYGVGIRALVEAIVLRLDVATSEEGPQFHLTIDQPF